MSTVTASPEQAARRGVVAVATAFFIWGLLPLYLKPLNAISALEIAAWRYAMGCLTVLGWLAWRGELAQIAQAFGQRRLLARLMLTGSLLAVNWVVYAWGVAHGQVLLTSLGYFINPLVNVVLGMLVLSERLNRAQGVAVLIAAAGVVGLTLQAGQVPWIALLLGFTFSVYGLLRKTGAVAPLAGLAVETLLFAPLAVVYLMWAYLPGMQLPSGELAQYSALLRVLLALSGVMTIVPLALFHHGAQRINYATVGMLQYIGPTLQFLIGVFIYRETLSFARLMCFVLIWLALAIYAGDGLWRSRAR